MQGINISHCGDAGPLCVNRELVQGAFNAFISHNPSFGNDHQIGLERERKDVYDQNCKAAIEIQFSPKQNRQLSHSKHK